MVGMKSTDRIRTAAWACLLCGVLIIAWQAASGGGSDKLFNIGLVAMITGSVLRVYGKYRRSNRRADVPHEPAEKPVSN
jgi:drug/metabolite transporter (DMT)-like permease